MKDHYKQTKQTKKAIVRWLLFVVVILGITTTKSMGQASLVNYAFNTGTNGSLDDLSIGSTAIMVGNNDDLGGTVTAIGFNFTFMGVTYTHFSANSNGQMTLHTSSGATAIGGSNVSALAASTVTLAPFAGDNEVNNGIRIKVIGTAPNRKLVVEWNQFYVNFVNITNAGNMQVWLQEGTGVITYMYGEIYNSNAASQTRSIFIASSNTATTAGSITIGAPCTFATSATLAVNTIAAGNGTTTAAPLIANIGSAANGSRTFFTFTPPAAPSAASALNFTAVTGTTTTLNWTDNATTESGYNIYRSTDGVNYTLIATTAANAITYPATGLAYGTTYFWRVVAYNEAASSANLDGSQTTSSGTFTGGVTPGFVTVGTGGDYSNLTTAFAAINAVGLANNIDIQLIAGYPAVAEPTTIPSSTASAVGPFNIHLYPTVSGLTISTVGTGTLNLNAAANLTIDGRVNGTGSTKDLIISNNALAAAGYAVQFINDASNNTVKYCTLRSSQNTAAGGTVMFGVGVLTGNDNNTIDNCDILDGTTNPVNGIFSTGSSAAINNSGNTVSNCNIANYFSATLATNGILLTAAGNSTWTINNNRFYQTATRVYTTANTHNVISILSGGGYTITDNTIGFANSAGTGTYNMIGNTVTLAGFPGSYVTTGTANATRLIAINLGLTAGAAASSIQNNTIAGFALFSSSGATTANGVWCGINLTSGNANIGTITGNTIGSTSGTGSVYLAVTTGGGVAVGIFATSTGTVTIQNNTIGAIDASGTTATLSGAFTGIDVAGTGGIFTISSNTIGNSTADNIRTGYFLSAANLSNAGTITSTTGATSPMVGIRHAASGTTVAINSNTLRGWVNSSTGGGAVTGITSTGSVTVSSAVNNNFLGTSGLGWMRWAFANTSGAVTGINLTGSSTTNTSHSIQNNDFRGLVYSVSGTGAHTYINLTGATGANDVTSIANNTFTNLTINSTGNVTFIGHSYTVAATGTQTITNNSIVTAFNKTGAGGTVTLATSVASSVAGAIINHTNNNFSNITVTGATTIAGWISTDGGTANKTYSGNTFNSWIGGTSPVTAMNIGNGGGNGGVGNSITNNTISNISTAGNITGIAIGVSGTIHSAFLNTIFGLSSTGATAAVTGISTSGGALTANVYRNKIYDLSASGLTPLVSGVAVSGSTAGNTNNIYNNLIGDLRATAASNGTTDVIRGINITSTAATSTINVLDNTIRISGSGGTDFTTTCVFHTASATATTAALNLRNNLLINLCTPSGTGVSSVLRRSAAATLGNYAATSNKNLLYAGAPSAFNAIMYDGTTVYSTFGPAATPGTYQNAVAADAASLTGEVAYDYSAVAGPTQFFQSITGSSSTFLHVLAGLTTQVESGADAIGSPSITVDFDGDTRSATPDIGADEFVGVTPAPAITVNSITPGTSAQCVATGRLISITATTPSGTITSVTITYNNGALNSNVAMTNTSGNIWEFTIPAASPANTAVTWSVTATNSLALSTSLGGTSYQDEPLFGVFAAITASVNPVITGNSTNLTAALYSGSLPAAPAASAYCASTHASGCSGDNISNVVLNTLSKATGATCGTTSAAYSNFSGLGGANTTTLTAGTSYSLNVSFGSDGNQYFGAWIDYNHDGVYSATENIGLSGNAGSNGTIGVSFTPNAATAFNGITRMRIVGGNDSPVLATQACGASSSGFGETQDYDVTITGALAFAPSAAPISSITWSNAATTNPITVTPAISTTYSATITSGACAVTPDASLLVTVLFPPAITFNSITPGTATLCASTARVVSVDVTTPGGTTLTGVTLQGNNGAAFGPIAMTNTSGNTYTGTIPVASPSNSTVTWSVIATNDAPLTTTYTGTSYQDDPLFGVTGTITASANPVCIGGSSILTAGLSSTAAATYATPPSVSFPTSDEDIGNVTIGGVLNNSTAVNSAAGTIGTATGTTGSFGNFSSFGPYAVTAGNTYSISLSSVQQGGGYTNILAAWIDYNRNGVFSDAGELVFTSTAQAGDFTESGSFTIPSGANNGLTRMRVISYEGTSISGPTQSVSYGEYEEYTLNISSANNGGGFAPAIASVLWSNGSTTNPTTVSPLSSTSYSVAITSGGCVVSPSPSLLVNVSAPPTDPTANNTAAVCAGVPTSSVTSTSGLPTPTFNWYSAATGGTMLQSSTSNTYTTAISATTTFYVSELNATTGCESGRVPVICSVYTLTVTSDAASFCSTGGSQSTLMHVVSNNPGFTYSWSSLGVGTVSPASGANVTATLSVTNDYLVTAVDGGCTMTNSISLGVYDFPTPNLTSNGPICQGGTISLNSGFVAGSFNASTITFAPLVAPVSAVNLVTNGVFTPPLGQTQATSSSDDGGWSQIPIPFNFSFFGTAYNALNVSTNGTLNFGPYASFNASQYTFSGFPSLSSPANTIAVAAHDMNTSTGNIRYWTAGFAPNRKFVVEYNGVKDFSGTLLNTAEAIFYETTGVVEIHVTSSPSTSYAKYVGLQDGTQTIGAAPVNGATAALSNQAWRFDPANHYTITWTGTNLVGPTSGTDIFTETTTAMSVGSYTYTFVGTDQTTGCTNSTNPASVTVNVLPTPVTPVASNITICGPLSVILTVSNAGSMGAADTLRWYSVATGGSVIARGASYTTPVVSGSTSYWVEAYNGACSNTGGRVQVDINVQAPPSISATGPATQICPFDLITLSASSSNPSYSYVWTPGNLSGATQTNIVGPGTTTTYTVTATDNTAGPFGTCATTATVLVDVRNTAVVNAGVDLSKNIGGTATLTATYPTPGGCLKITEITLFKSGTGATASYPTYAVGDDLLEITNTGTNPVSLGGIHLKNEGVRTMDYIFPAATVAPGGVVIVNFGTGTDDLINNAFFTGGQTGSSADQWSSGTSNGIWLTQSDGITVIDAVATNGWSFSGGSGVTGAMWTGSAVGLSGDAGTRLTGPDLNDATGWVTASTSAQDQGTANTGVPLNCNSNPYTITWTGGNLTGPFVGDVVTTPVFIAPPQTWTYTVSLTDGVCTTTDNVDVTTQFPVAPTANFTVNNVNQTTGATTSTAIFTDASLNVPDTYSWNITGPGVVTYVNSTTSASQNPQVQFGGVGQYTVALTVSNAAGSDTKTEVNYITVTAVYCASNATNTADEEIFGVTFAGINSISNCGQTGGAGSILNEYSNYTGLTPAEVAVGYTFPITLKTSACGTGTFSAGYSVFIDYNQDGDFADVGESVFASTVTTPTPPSVLTTFTGNITIPMTASIGLTRMRVVLTEGNATPPACGTYGYGETEDYTININPQPTAVPTCPSGISVNGVTCITSTSLSWTAATGFPQGYYLYIGTDGGGVTTPTSLLFGQDVGSNLTVTLPTLAPNTLYYYQVASYNTFGENTTCSIGSFTSGTSTTQTPTQAPSSYTETLDNGVVPPALPCGLTKSDENFPQDGFSWYTSTTAPHAGTRHLQIDKNPNNTTAKDDWFYSAPMNMTAGKLYRIYFWHRVSTAGTENFEAFLSSAPDAATMLTTSAVFNGSSNLLTYKLDSSSDILPATSGIYYYGFHANGAANGRSLYMDDIQVKEIAVAALSPASCTTIPSMYDQLLVQPIYGAQDYKFKIENLANSFSYEYTRNLPIPDFRLKWAPGVVYDLTYDVSVAYKKNNVWSPYGASCPVTMGPFPTTQLRGASCGATLIDQYTPLYIDSVSGANDYEYRIVQNTLAYDHTWMRGAPTLDYRLYWAYQTSPTLVDRIPYGFTYDVQVRALVGRTGPAQGNLPGVFGTFGPVCTVTLAGQPQTQLKPTSCGITLASITDQIFCVPVTGASNYRYHVVNTALGYDVTAMRNSSVNDYRLTWLPTVGGVGLRFGTTYDITVSDFVGGVWSTEGPMCQVTTPAQPLTQLQPAYCLYTLPTFSTTIFSTAVAGATNYRYRITDVATSGATYTKIVDRNSPGNDFKFSWTLVCCGGLNMLPNQPYHVEVASYAGGVWSAYGTMCTVTTSATIPRYTPFLAEEGLVEGSQNLNLSVYPNPAAVAEEFAIELSGIQGANEKVELSIYNMLGEKAYRSEIVTKTESNLIIKPEQVLAPGVYMVEAKLNGAVYREKFVVK